VVALSGCNRPGLRVLARTFLALLLLGAATGRAQPGAGDDLLFQPALPRLEPSRQLLLDIARAGDRLVAVGDSGLVITSDDQGASWQQAAVPVSATLTAVEFVDAQRGWAVGHAGVILHTVDAGSSWSLQFDGHRANQAWLAFTQGRRSQLENQLETLAEDAAEREDLDYELEEAIFAEEDAAAAIETGPADPFLDISFIDARRGFAVGAYGMFYRTDDGGENWRVNAAAVDNPERYHYYAILVHSPETLYLAGEAGLLYRSDDGGESFERYDDIYGGSLFGLLPLGDAVLAYGLRGNLFLQPAGSDEWEALDSGDPTSLYGGGSLDDGSALLLGAGGALVQIAPRRQVRLMQHPSRTTLAAAVSGSDGRVWLVGVEGIARLDEARRP
jgi:photosystem II stability/assembly factor-like uncharacterized protein